MAAVRDIVYVLKNDIKPDELRYSLRSIEANFPFRRVWFFGGLPPEITPDAFVDYEQQGNTKWARAVSTFREICNTEEVSSDFWLFNDDFYILKKVRTLPYMTHGSLADRVAELRSRVGESSYTKELNKLNDLLTREGLTTRSYALHVPMRINKAKALEVLDRFPDCYMFRSLYGNYHNVGGRETDDVKIFDNEGLPAEGQALLSTSDASFRHGKVGEFIRAQFPNKSRWEV